MEFALIAPLFLLLLAGIIEFGQAMSIRHSLSASVRRGARASIVEGATSSQVIQKVKADCSRALRVAAGKIAVRIAVNGAAGRELSQAEPGDEITVTAEVPYSAAGAGFYAHLFRSKNLQSSCTLEHE